MSSHNLLLKMQLDDQLTSKLKASLDALSKMGDETRTLDNRLKDLKANKGGILAGVFTADSKALKKLQKDMLRYKNVYENTSSKPVKARAKVKYQTAKAKVDHAYRNEIRAEEKALQSHKVAVQKDSIALQGQYAELIRNQKAVKHLSNSTRGATATTRGLTKANMALGSSFTASSNDIVRMIRRYESLLVGIYAVKTGYDLTLGRGFEFNKLIETETVGLKLLIAQNLKNTNVLGQSVSATEKFAYAQTLANDAIRIAREINVQTPHTLGETLQIYKLLVPQVMKYGGTLQDVGVITKNVSITAASMGIEFQQLLKTVDSLMSGQMKESGLKRAMEQFGISQKAINQTVKDGGNVVELFINKLKQVDPAGKAITSTWKGVSAQFINTWDELQGKVQEPIFNQMKTELLDVTALLKRNEQAILDTVDNIGSLLRAATETGKAYAGLRIGQIVFNKLLATNTALQVANARAIKLSEIQATRYGIVVSANTLRIRAMGAALMAFGRANGIMLAATVGMLAYEWATSSTREAEDKLAESVGRSRDEIAKLTEAQQKQAEGAIRAKTLELNAEKASILYSRTVTEVVLGRNHEITQSMKARLGAIESEKKALSEQLGIYAQITPYVKATLEARIQMTKEIESNKLEIIAINQSLVLGDRLTKDAINAAKEKRSVLEDENKALSEGVFNANQFLQSQKYAVIEANGVANATKEITAELKRSVSFAYQLGTAMTGLLVAQGKLSNLQALDRNIALESKKILDSTEAGKDRDNQIAKLGIKYQTDKIGLLKQEHSKTLDIKIANANAHKDKKKSLSLEIQRVKERNDLSKEDKKIAIDTLRENAKSKAASKGRLSTAKAITSENKKSLNYTIALLKEKGKQALLDKQISIGGTQGLSTIGTLLLKEASLTEEKRIQLKLIKEAKEALANSGVTDKRAVELQIEKLKTGDKGIDLKRINNRTSQDKDLRLDAPTIVEEVFNPYVALLDSQKDYIKNIKLAGKNHELVGKISAKQTSLQLKGYAGLVNGAKGFFKENSKGYDALNTAQRVLQAFEFAWFIKKEVMNKEGLLSTLFNVGAETTAVVAGEQVKQVAKGTTAVINQGTGGEVYSAWARMAAMAATVAALGVAISGGGVSDGAKAKAKGRTDFKDNGLGNTSDLFKDAINPLEKNTMTMNKYLQSIDKNMFELAKISVDKLNLSGSDIKTTEVGDFVNTRRTELLDSKLQLNNINFRDNIQAQTIKEVLTTQEHLWGLFSSESIKTMTSDAGTEFNKYLSKVMQDGKDFIITSGKLLGSDVTAQINAYNSKMKDISFKGLDEQGVQDRLNKVFSEIFSDAIGGTNLAPLVSEFGKQGESMMSTLGRISLSFAQANSAMQNMDGAFKSQSVRDTLNTVKGAGGDSELSSYLNSYKENYFSEAEQLKFQTNKMRESFKSLGLELPKTNDQFKDLVKNSSGELRGQLLGLNEEFYNMTKSAMELRKESIALKDDLLKDLVDMRTGSLSYLTDAQKLDYGRQARDAGTGNAQSVAQMSFNQSANVYEYKSDYLAMEEERRKEYQDAKDALEAKDTKETERYEAEMAQRERLIELNESLLEEYKVSA